MKRKYSVFLGNVGTCFDRYCPEYAKPFTTRELFERVASIDLLSGVDLVAVPDLLDDWKTVKQCVEDTGLKVVSIAVDHFTQAKWRQGTFSSTQAHIREQAVSATKEIMDLCAELGSDIATIWPGQDGWDYLFQADYMQERTWFTDSIREACKHRSDVRIGIEYKLKEPRTHSYLNSASTTLLMLQEIGQDNCGGIIDYGHALLGYENPAESIVLFKKYGDKLFHVHINDNYRAWDDDMIVGSVRSIEFLEFFYWLRRTGYNEWLTIDQFPYREDGRNAVNESAVWLDLFESIMDEADMDEIQHVLQQKDAVEASRLARKLMFKK